MTLQCVAGALFPVLLVGWLWLLGSYRGSASDSHWSSLSLSQSHLFSQLSLFLSALISLGLLCLSSFSVLFVFLVNLFLFLFLRLCLCLFPFLFSTFFPRTRAKNNAFTIRTRTEMTLTSTLVVHIRCLSSSDSNEATQVVIKQWCRHNHALQPSNCNSSNSSTTGSKNITCAAAATPANKLSKSSHSEDNSHGWGCASS